MPSHSQIQPSAPSRLAYRLKYVSVLSIQSCRTGLNTSIAERVLEHLDLVRARCRESASPRRP